MTPFLAYNLKPPNGFCWESCEYLKNNCIRRHRKQELGGTHGVVKWFVMSNSHTFYEIDTDMRPLQYFHTVNSLDAGVGAVYLESVVAPDI